MKKIMNNKEAKETSLIDQYDNIGYETNLLLSQNLKLTYDTWKTHLGCMNVLVIGATGEGKSRNLVRPISYSLLKDPKSKKSMSFVFTDPKGELYQDTAGFFEANGYKIKVLNLIDMLHSDCYNCFKYFNFSKNPDITLMNFINSLVDASSGSGDGGSKDPYWPNMAKNLINSLAFYAYYELPAEYQNLSVISDMVPLFFKGENDEFAPIDKLYEKVKNVSLNKHPAIKWRNKIKNAQGKELGSILGATNDALRLWADSNVRRLTEVDTINLDKIGDEPTALYVITPPDNSTFDFIVGTFYDQLISTLMYKANFIYNKKGLPHHVILMQDEAANTGKINDYNKKIAVWRSVNMSSIQIVQSSNQFKAMYGDKAQDVIDNAHITIFLGNGGNSIDNNGTAASDFISRALGKTTVKTESYSINYQKNEMDPLINSSINSSQRELMTPDEVKRLKYDECIVMVKGYKPFIDKKINLDTCLNFASSLYSNYSNGHWKLKDEFIYNIEEKKSTLEAYYRGKKETKEIDLIQSKTVKNRLIIDSLFSSFNKDGKFIYFEPSQFISVFELYDYLNTYEKYYSSEEIIGRYKMNPEIMGCFIRDSIYQEKKSEEKTKQKENTNNNSNHITQNLTFEMSLEEIKKIVALTKEGEEAIKKYKKGDKTAIINYSKKIGV